VIHVVTFVATAGGVVVGLFRTLRMVARARRRIREDM
jgi:hypothetical protein